MAKYEFVKDEQMYVENKYKVKVDKTYSERFDKEWEKKFGKESTKVWTLEELCNFLDKTSNFEVKEFK